MVRKLFKASLVTDIHDDSICRHRAKKEQKRIKVKGFSSQSSNPNMQNPVRRPWDISDPQCFEFAAFAAFAEACLLAHHSAVSTIAQQNVS